MSEANSSQQQEKAVKIRRKPERDSVLTPMFAAARHSVDGTLWDRNQQYGGLLQRQCACGTHTIGGGECDRCRKKRESSFLQRTAIIEEQSAQRQTVTPAAISQTGPMIIQRQISYAAGRFSNEQELLDALKQLYPGNRKAARLIEYWVRQYENRGGRLIFATIVYRNVIWHLEKEDINPTHAIVSSSSDPQSASRHGPQLPTRTSRDAPENRRAAMSTFNFPSVTLGRLSVFTDDDKRIDFHDRQINANFHAEDGLMEQLENYLAKHSIGPSQVILNLTINNFVCSDETTTKADRSASCLEEIIKLAQKYRFQRFHLYFQNPYYGRRNRRRNKEELMTRNIRRLQEAGILVSSFLSSSTSRRRDRTYYSNPLLDPHSGSDSDSD